MTILEATNRALVEKASAGLGELSEYLGDHIGRDSLQHFMSYSTGEWLGGLLTLDNGVTIDSYHGKLEHGEETCWIYDARLELMLDDIFFTVWETGDIDPLDIIEEL
jgi:hypothetical protein